MVHPHVTPAMEAMTWYGVDRFGVEHVSYGSWSSHSCQKPYLVSDRVPMVTTMERLAIAETKLRAAEQALAESQKRKSEVNKKLAASKARYLEVVLGIDEDYAPLPGAAMSGGLKGELRRLQEEVIHLRQVNANNLEADKYNRHYMTKLSECMDEAIKYINGGFYTRATSLRKLKALSKEMESFDGWRKPS
ncbi:hypothetical protein HBA92_21350 [Ochrobactrum sp. MR28]|nr:hypothetical protein [Ochrobactrum sp. MR28]MBX8818845.1 hypothetical protein [Ochrobactrum sp. MR31]